MIEPHWEYFGNLKPTHLKKIEWLIKYLKLEDKDQYKQIKHFIDAYNRWSKNLEKFNDIESALEQP